jgi:hypothetical protein
VDAIVLEDHLGLMDGAVIADGIKHLRPHVPIVMLTGSLKLPSASLKSVDALVARADGPHFLLAVVHFLLNVRPDMKAQMRTKPLSRRKSSTLEAPFSPQVWRGIRNGNFEF